MSVSNRMVFDATDADSMSASSNVGAYIRAADGTLITATTTSLDVNITNTDVPVTFSNTTIEVTQGTDPWNVAFTGADDALANTAASTEAVAVSTSAVAVTASALAARKYVLMANEGSKKGYWGITGVTTGTGFPIHAGERQELRCGASVALFYIGGTGSSSADFRTAQLS